jgi:hypothetical protein
MSRRAGFIPAARFEVASETDSFREGWDASDGDGDGGSRDAVPPPRPTSVPAAVLSGERARPADFGGGSRGASHLAPTHPSSDVPRWQTHLTPMQQWELRLRGAASLRDAGNTSAPERRPRNVANHPRLALQRQHEHARRLRAKEGMTQTLDLLERAARKRVEKKENAEATFSSFAADREYEESDVSSPASPASPSSAKAAADAKTVDETVEESATRVAPNDREREKRDSDRDPGPDPFASLFDAAFHESDDETDAKNSQRASSIRLVGIRPSRDAVPGQTRGARDPPEGERARGALGGGRAVGRTQRRLRGEGGRLGVRLRGGHRVAIVEFERKPRRKSLETGTAAERAPVPRAACAAEIERRTRRVEERRVTNAASRLGRPRAYRGVRVVLGVFDGVREGRRDVSGRQERGVRRDRRR